MSDEQKPMTRRLGAPGGAVGAGPKGPRPARAPQPPPPSGGSGLRKALLLGIIFSCLALGGMIAWRLWQKFHVKERQTIDVMAEYEKIVDKGKDASKAIFAIQTKVWGKNAELTPEDFTAIKAELNKLVDCEEQYQKLLMLLRTKNLEDSLEKQKIIPTWLQTKMWILDATDLVENQKPPEYGGLNIPMFVTSEKIRKAQDELKEINTLKNEVIKEGNPEKIKAARKRIGELRDAFRAHATKLQALDQYVQDGLARPDLTSKEVMELDHLRDEANKAQMAVVAAGKLLQAYPE